MRLEDIQRILMIGSGIMGRQVGWQFATHGYDVVLYDVSDQALREAEATLDRLAQEFTSNGTLTAAEASKARARIEFEGDAAKAAHGVSLVSESVLENLNLKRQVFARFHEFCPPEAVFTTNTSSLLPSKIAGRTGRPEQFCAFHFHQPVWDSNVVDIMPHPDTDPDVVTLLQRLAVRIDQIPILLKKESSGYVFNAMLDAVLGAAMQLRAENIASIEDVDRAWMGVTKMPIGPFGVLDLVGIDLAYDVVTEKTNLAAFLPRVRRLRRSLKAKVDAGELGIKSGRGFYEYPEPAYQHPEFVAGL